MVRIKYKYHDGTLTSQEIDIITDWVKIVVNLKKMRYYILSCTNNALLDEGTGINRATLMKQAKSKIRVMGARFYDERRSNAQGEDL